MGSPDMMLSVTIVMTVLSGWCLIVEVLRLQRAARISAPRSLSPLCIRVLWPALVCLGWVIRPLMSAQWRHRLHARLEYAGLERALGPQHWVALRLVVALLSVMAGFALLVAGQSIALGLIVSFIFVALNWPDLWLRRRVRERRMRVLRGLPFLIDLLAMSVEAGMPLSAAFSQSVERLPPGPLRDECWRVVRNVQAGLARDEALRALAVRVELPAVTHLVMALSAAQRDGNGIVQVLRAQAEQQRHERFLRAEHRASEAPVRMLFPLLVFIFPGTLAVVLYPVVSRMLAELGRW
jgi:tight adherence protein C